MTFSIHIPPSLLLKNTYFLNNVFSKSPSLFLNQSKYRTFHHLTQYPYLHSPKILEKANIFERHNFCTSSVCGNALKQNSSTPVANQPAQPGKKKRNKEYRESATGILQRKLEWCSKQGDVMEALRLYDDARSQGVALGKVHYNALFYLCSSDGDDSGEGLRRGFEIYKQMGVEGIEQDEATFTTLARLAFKKEDPEMAFELVKKMISAKIVPKLRSYDPALFGFCKKGDADKAYEVDEHMVGGGVYPEEAQLAALLEVSARVEKGDKVYETLHRLRASVGEVVESTGGIIEEWFKSRAAREVGKESWDVEKVKEGILKGGGGWHGQGWLGMGEWKVVRTEMEESGVCCCCGERLACIDIDPLETENFAKKLSRLACQREKMSDFVKFQHWLRSEGPFDAVIDGANVSLNNAHAFSFFQLNAVVELVREMSPTKRYPLIILHIGRVVSGPANNRNNKKLLDKWRKAGALYVTPKGSNDDWYWIYAAVSSKCLLVTNDEMRDHLFQLLGRSFFPRWKEKHQVRYLATRQGTILKMPPPYSSVIQESERGSWHVPIVVTGEDTDSPRQWICATRASTSSSS
ncbi:ribonuclease P [Ranunculus cassubicifolius]